MIKRLLPIVVLILAALTIFFACQKKQPPITGPFKVAMLLPGPVDDGSFNQQGLEGLLNVKSQLGAEITYTDQMEGKDSVAEFRKYAKEGYSLIIGLGAEFIDDIVQVASEFPDSKFAIIADHPGNFQNLAAFSFRNGELGFLAGATAALKSKTGKIAYLGGISYDHLKRIAFGVKDGAEYLKPGTQVTVQWTESWTNSEKALVAARQLFESGHDVIIVDLNPAGLVVYQEAETKGFYVIGWGKDWHELAPARMLTSGIQRIPFLIGKAAEKVKQGKWKAQQFSYGIKDGAQNMAPFYGLLSKDQEKKILQIRQELIDGKIRV